MTKEKACKELTDVITEWVYGRKNGTIKEGLPTYLINLGYTRHKPKREHLVTYNGVEMRVSDWARKMGIPVSTLKMRLYYGWSVEKALTTPVSSHEGSGKRKAVQQCNKQGVVLRTFESIKEAAKTIGCNPMTITKCCKGELHTVGGYVWKFMEVTNGTNN